jgi:hypothetical protein
LARELRRGRRRRWVRLIQRPRPVPVPG